MIYKIILELTNNIFKHSRAKEATVQLLSYEDYLHIMIDDNGVGFDKEIKTGSGLKNINPG
jgi:signal transduction histidine kinase